MASSEVRLFPLDGATHDDARVRAWLAALPPETGALARAWFLEWRACGADVKELLHDGQPTACVDGIALGYVAAFKHHVNVGFFLGSALADPHGLLEGTGKYMRHVKVRPGQATQAPHLRALIQAAYADLKHRLAPPA